eukprot:CAMPEP_0177161222 /NCGR_PEP_ID=MMETSP0367-20130122/5247_1 /TAXON_ID=447022 ORGANISM="Scrippsiella hangoei-like, Strain SHHI-4" /NCGR_SAMPLE_ID=MMETSP0367 /ASSEMBLY_ACC=CAM_ASM_000362 /LENGTH=401 /DNA_ID=CAMNT_0018606933 /DNA_START=27 /DNA_END=1229 /DNA_ORIENTATION=+
MCNGSSARIAPASAVGRAEARTAARQQRKAMPLTPSTPEHVKERTEKMQRFEQEVKRRLKPKQVEKSSEVLATPALNLVEDLLDELDARGAAGEMLSQYMLEQSEVQALIAARGPSQGAIHLPAEIREICLRTMAALVSLVGLNDSKRIDAALLLDTYCALQKSSMEDLIESIPATCAAVVHLLRKMESQKCSTTSAALARVASQASLMLQQVGYRSMPEVTQQDVLQQEHLIRATLQWRLRGATVPTWLQLICKRMDVISCGNWSGVIEWVIASSSASAMTLVLHQRAYADMAPQQMANGLLGVFLVTAGLVPLQSMKPADVMLGEWEALYAKSQGQGCIPTCTLHPSMTPRFLCLLEMASGCRLDLLQNDMLATMSAMLEIVRKATEASPGQQSGARIQ